MTDVLHIAESIVGPPVRALIAEQRDRRNRTLPLSELINASRLDDYKKRRFGREVEAMRDSVAENLEKTLGHDWAKVPPNEQAAMLQAVADVFQSADLSDEALFAADADPIKLARQMRATVEDVQVKSGISSDLHSIYDRLIDECCVVYVQLAIHLSSFTPRGIAAILDRASSLSDSVEMLLSRLPKQPLGAKIGTEMDQDFTRRYLAHISSNLDELDLFGIDVHRYRPRTTLSVAYISLSVRSDDMAVSTSEDIRWERGKLLDGTLAARNSFQIERALATSNRILIRGEAGSGKTTLLRWLAINSARSNFSTTLAKWNGYVPFLVTLRSYAGAELPRPEDFLDGTAQSITGLMPDGWVHRQLEVGNALLLVDGVDELPAGERRPVRDWIHNILSSYPTVSVVITSRPSAAAQRWLLPDEFSSANLERMDSHDVRELITHWHAAIRDAGNLPCRDDELPAYERSLLARIDANPHLQGLATNPLLCAMLCALNLDRRTALPNNRMNLYAAALDLLLERRDAERRIAEDHQIHLDLSGKLELLQHLAWRLSLNNRSELSRAEAERRLAERLAAMPVVSDNAREILDHLARRSGVIREPVPGRIDFIHRTFQEYLTAREAAEQGDIGILVDKAHLDSWRETIVMAAGHANKPTTHELLSQLLSRAANEPRHARSLRLLAAACLETCGSLDAELNADILLQLSAMLPPRRIEEAQSLSRVGIALLKLVPKSLAGLSPAASSATIASVALVGGPEALDLLADYAASCENDAGSRATYELLRSCKYFDAKDYGRNVFSRLSAECLKSHSNISSFHELEAWRSRPGPLDLRSIQLYEAHDLGDILRGIRALDRLWVSGLVSDLSPVSMVADSIRDLVVWSSIAIEDLGPLAKLTSLRDLVLSQAKPIASIDFLRSLPVLEQLWLPGLDLIEDFSALSDLKRLKEIRLYSRVADEAYGRLAGLGLTTFSAAHSSTVAQFAHHVDKFSTVESFMFMGPHADTDYRFLGILPNLQTLFIRDEKLKDISFLSDLSQLKSINLDCPLLMDYSPLLPLAHSQGTILLNSVSPESNVEVLDDLPDGIRSRVRGSFVRRSE